MQIKIGFLLTILGLLLCTSCEEVVYTPKPRGYPKINFPKKGMTTFDADYCAFTFQYPSYAQITKDTVSAQQLLEHPCWFDLYFPEFDGKLHCSYIEVGKDKAFDEIREDAFDLANWHTKKADYIDESRILNEQGAFGILYELEGPVASPFQYFLTDADQKHFFRASLYFNSEVKPDSIAPVYEFLRKDLDKMIQTFEWAN